MIKALSQACDAGYHWSDHFGGCVLDDPDIIVPVPGTAPPATASSNFLMYAGIGLGLILLLGAFAGGRASKKSLGERRKVTKSFWINI